MALRKPMRPGHSKGCATDTDHATPSALGWPPRYKPGATSAAYATPRASASRRANRGS